MTDEKLNKGSAVALGNFDGMHIGHLAVLDKTAELRPDLTATVMLFDEHSLKAVSGEAPPMLMTEKERIKIIEAKGLEARTISFKEIKDLTPEEFVDSVLIVTFNAKAVVCGFNYRVIGSVSRLIPAKAIMNFPGSVYGKAHQKILLL